MQKTFLKTDLQAGSVAPQGGGRQANRAGGPDPLNPLSIAQAGTNTADTTASI